MERYIFREVLGAFCGEVHFFRVCFVERCIFSEKRVLWRGAFCGEVHFFREVRFVDRCFCREVHFQRAMHSRSNIVIMW